MSTRIIPPRDEDARGGKHHCGSQRAAFTIVPIIPLTWLERVCSYHLPLQAPPPPPNLMIRDSNIPEAMECSKPDKVCTFIISICSRFMYTLKPQAGIWLILFYWCWNCLFNFECIMPCIPIIILACCILLYKRTAHAGRTPSTVTDQLPLSRSADRVRLQSPSLSKG